MTTNKSRLLGLVVAAMLAAGCGGGGGDGENSRPVHFSKLVAFGDSLSDVGTYAVSGVEEAGGGKFTINGPDSKIWVERLAGQAGVGAPCAAQTGLETDEDRAGFAAAPITDHEDCFNYAQGGARVTERIGPYNKALNVAEFDHAGALGQMTVPVLTQMERHLAAAGGSYAGDELVTVLAGGNDVSSYLGALGIAFTPEQVVTFMGEAGAELAFYVNQLVVAKGAKHVVVVNLPDVSQTPSAAGQPDDVKGLINLMVTTFNDQLAAGLEGVPEVLLVDAYTQNRDQTANPAQYKLSNVTDVACDFEKVVYPVPVPMALFCTADTLIDGDTSHYLYADSVHPTPFGYQLLAQFVAERMLLKGWL